MVYSNGQLESEERGGRGEKGDPGLPGIDEKRLTDVADSIDEGDAVNLKVLSVHNLAKIIIIYSLVFSSIETLVTTIVK